MKFAFKHASLVVANERSPSMHLFKVKTMELTLFWILKGVSEFVWIIYITMLEVVKIWTFVFLPKQICSTDWEASVVSLNFFLSSMSFETNGRKNLIFTFSCMSNQDKLLYQRSLYNPTISRDVPYCLCFWSLSKYKSRYIYRSSWNHGNANANSNIFDRIV